MKMSVKNQFYLRGSHNCFWLKTLPHVGSSTLWYSMYLLPNVLLFKHVALPYWYGYLLAVLSSIPLLGFSKLKGILLETPSGHSLMSKTTALFLSLKAVLMSLWHIMAYVI
jgi:hypothetical protein